MRCAIGAVRMMIVAGALAGGCQAVPREPGAGAGAYADIPPAELREVLAGLARSHEQKMQLAFYVALPWTGVDEPFKDFYAHMSEVQGDLDKELHAWAKGHNMDLAFHFSEEVEDKAREMMEGRQQKVIMGDNRTDLTRDTLIQMYMDYEWQISVVQTLLPKVREPGLKAYLERSLKAHVEGGAEIARLLKKYKWS